MTDSIKSDLNERIDHSELFCNPYPPEHEDSTLLDHRVPSPVLDSLEDDQLANVSSCDGKLLTNLVRQTYLFYLKNCLVGNYKAWLAAAGGGMELTDKVLTKCAHVMERTALRQCMITSLYRRAINDIINNVKKSTDRWRLHEDLLRALNWSCGVRDAWTQSGEKPGSSERSEMVSVACQTDNLSNHSNEKPNPALDLFTSSTENSIEKKTVTIKNTYKPGPKLKQKLKDLFSENDSLENSLAISSVTLLDVRPQPVPPAICPILPLNIKNLPPLPAGQDLFLQESVSAPSFPTNTAKKESTVKSVTKLTDSKERTSKKRKAHNVLIEPFKKRKFCLNEEPKKKPLEERLKKFEALFGDNSNEISENVEKKKESSLSQLLEAQPVKKEKFESDYTKFFVLINWKSEAIAQTCQLNKVLSLLTLEKRNAVLSRFVELFGIDGTEARLVVQEQRGMMLPDDFHHCRQRTANLVVSELTKLYDHSRIASRPVFKAMAQEITSIILAETFAPGMDTIKKYIEKIFANGAKYSTVEEVSIIASNFR